MADGFEGIDSEPRTGGDICDRERDSDDSGAYWKQGNLDALLAENLRRAEVFGCSEEIVSRLKSSCTKMRTVYAASGQKGLTSYMLEHMPQDDGGALFVQRSVLYGAAGQMDAAFEQLDRALALRDPALVYLAVGPQWDMLREDPRFNQCLSGMGLGRQVAGEDRTLFNSAS